MLCGLTSSLSFIALGCPLHAAHGFARAKFGRARGEVGRAAAPTTDTRRPESSLPRRTALLDRASHGVRSPTYGVQTLHTRLCSRLATKRQAVAYVLQGLWPPPWGA